MDLTQHYQNGSQLDNEGGAAGEHPVFSQPIVNGDQCIGGTINIDFQVKGYPDPQLQWFKNNQLLNLGGRINLFGGIEGWYTLQIKDLCIEDQGTIIYNTADVFVSRSFSSQNGAIGFGVIT